MPAAETITLDSAASDDQAKLENYGQDPKDLSEDAEAADLWKEGVGDGGVLPYGSCEAAHQDQCTASVTALAEDALVDHHLGVTQGQVAHMNHHANLPQGAPLPNVLRGTGDTNHTHQHRQVMGMQYKLIAKLDKRNSIGNTGRRSRFEATNFKASQKNNSTIIGRITLAQVDRHQIAVGDALACLQVVTLALRVKGFPEAEGTADDWQTALLPAQSEEQQR
ncbi:MAG: hypothetical protein FRX49_13247 [Trebouxia sp. A1-2]|nr:MAG: hypothetical protein FRX49_13247 [Trebouxia sp. A1-2]